MAARPVLVLLVVSLSVVYAKQCKKLDNCRCEMDDGSGIIDLNDINNKDGSPRFQHIRESGSEQYTYSYNPCTPLVKGPDEVCKDSHMCQIDALAGGSISYFPCDAGNPSFTVDSNNNVVLKYTKKTYASYTRSTEITLVCGSGQATISSVKQDVPPGTVATSIYKATLTAKSACPSTSGGGAGGLSTGSILLIIFFPLLLLYVVIGIIINVKVRNKQSVPEACPNYEFWADFPSLVKDGCIFSFDKLKSCCCFLYAKAKGDGSYAEI